MFALFGRWITKTIYSSRSSEYNILSFTAFAGNSLLIVALRKVSSLHPPSKLLYRCLATTDLLVGLISQPLYATCWISLVDILSLQTLEFWSISKVR